MHWTDLFCWAAIVRCKPLKCILQELVLFNEVVLKFDCNCDWVNHRGCDWEKKVREDLIAMESLKGASNLKGPQNLIKKGEKIVPTDKTFTKFQFFVGKNP